jgi:hypothetical protein
MNKIENKFTFFKNFYLQLIFFFLQEYSDRNEIIYVFSMTLNVCLIK